MVQFVNIGKRRFLSSTKVNFLELKTYFQDNFKGLYSLISTMSGSIEQKSSNKSFGGYTKVFSHDSSEVKTKMNFGIYLPPKAENERCPVLYWLSGLTCTEQNIITKSGFQRVASELGLIVVCPDTSPRGANIDGDKDHWDFGEGAAYYVDATEEKWKNNYRMYSYVMKELPSVIENNFPVLKDKQSIFGHSVGGHGALICVLKNPGHFKSLSVFAPVSNPMVCPWGEKAFSAFLGENKDEWKKYDATELSKIYDGPTLDILIDQGTDDCFGKNQLFTKNFVAANEANVKLNVNFRMHDGYDHGFYFISTFIEDHLRHHAKYLC